jgi:hypothetical protein
MSQYEKLLPIVENWAREWNSYKDACGIVAAEVFQGFVDETGFPAENVRFLKLDRNLEFERLVLAAPKGAVKENIGESVKKEMPTLMPFDDFLFVGVLIEVGDHRVWFGAYGMFLGRYGFRKDGDIYTLRTEKGDQTFKAGEKLTALYNDMIEGIMQIVSKPIHSRTSEEPYYLGFSPKR